MAKIDNVSNEGEAVEVSSEVEGAVSIRVDKDKYQDARTSTGTKSLNNGDVVAEALTGMTLSEVQTLADSFIGENDFRTRYAKLNLGMQRMNIGNRLRGAISKANGTDEAGDPTDSGVVAFEKAAKPLIKEAATRAKAIAKDLKDKTEAAAKVKADKLKAAAVKEKAAA
jgi:hypothetical protein